MKTSPTFPWPSVLLSRIAFFILLVGAPRYVDGGTLVKVAKDLIPTESTVVRRIGKAIDDEREKGSHLFCFQEGILYADKPAKPAPSTKLLGKALIVEGKDKPASFVTNGGVDETGLPHLSVFGGLYNLGGRLHCKPDWQWKKVKDLKADQIELDPAVKFYSPNKAYKIDIPLNRKALEGSVAMAYVINRPTSIVVQFLDDQFFKCSLEKQEATSDVINVSQIDTRKDDRKPPPGTDFHIPKDEQWTIVISWIQTTVKLYLNGSIVSEKVVKEFAPIPTILWTGQDDVGIDGFFSGGTFNSQILGALVSDHLWGIGGVTEEPKLGLVTFASKDEAKDVSLSEKEKETLNTGGDWSYDTTFATLLDEKTFTKEECKNMGALRVALADKSNACMKPQYAAEYVDLSIKAPPRGNVDKRVEELMEENQRLRKTLPKDTGGQAAGSPAKAAADTSKREGLWTRFKKRVSQMFRRGTPAAIQIAARVAAPRLWMPMQAECFSVYRKAGASTTDEEVKKFREIIRQADNEEQCSSEATCAPVASYIKDFLNTHRRLNNIDPSEKMSFFPLCIPRQAPLLQGRNPTPRGAATVEPDASNEEYVAAAT